MSARTIRILLAVSVALNLFMGAALATTILGRERVEARVAEQVRPPRNGGFPQMLAQMDPEARQRVGETLRASALAARPDFEEARSARREAVALARAPQFDAARVTALLDQSREAEIRGRAKLEAEAVRLLATLDADDRQALSQILSRRGGRGRSGPDGARPAEAKR